MKLRTIYLKICSIKTSLDAFFTEFVEEFPEFLESLAAGYSTQSPDEYTRLERLLKGFIVKDKILFGKTSVYRVHSLWSLAEFYRKHYRYGEAEKLYRTGSKLLVTSIAEEQRLPFQFRERMSEFIDFLDLYSKTQEAENLQRELIDKTQGEGIIKQKALDLTRLAQLCGRNGNEKEAAVHFKNARDLLEPILGGASNELLAYLEEQKFTFGRMDLSDSFLSDLRKQINLLDQILISERALGKDHEHCIPALEALRDYYCAQNKSGLAEILQVDRDIAFLARKTKDCSKQFASLRSQTAILRDLEELARLYKLRNQGADATMAFHALAKAKRIRESAKLRNR